MKKTTITLSFDEEKRYKESAYGKAGVSGKNI